jgi:GT2 family glycosyltransferase
MPNASTTHAQQRVHEPGKAPTVLVVLVVRDGAAWLRQCLIALSRQTHPRLGVVAVDNGSSDASPEMLETTLGSDRVIRLGQNRGFGGAAGEALKSATAERADYLLLLHDDTVLAADAVERLVDIAERVDGAGVVGAKVRDADHPDVLLDVGQTIDRFGYPYSPLEAGEIDQGQYDRLREVMAVSSSAMMIRSDLAAAIGLPDDRFPTRFADVDFCWRARVAGYRVLMAPRAVALHRSAGGRGQRSTTTGRSRGARYERERAGLAGVLKNYRLLTLLWTLPLWLAQSAGRTIYLLLSRRLEDAFQMAAAVWWNVRHLPGTLRRRRRAQRARRTRDHEVRRFMAPAGELARRWAISVAEWARPQQEAAEVADEDVLPVSGWRLAGQFASAHPLLVAWVAAALLAAVAYRHLAGVHPLVGGAIAAFPSSATGFFGELVSGVRTTGLGGTQAASPALGMLGLGSVAALGNTDLVQKGLLFVLPAAAAVGAARATHRITGQRVPAVVAGAAYALSPVVMWAFSQGLIPDLVFLAGLPWLASRLQAGFEVRPGRARVRWAIGVGAGLAVLVSFFPGTLLAAAMVVLASLLAPGEGTRRGGLLGTVLALVLAALLVFPFAWVLVDGAGHALSETVGVRTFAEVARLSPGSAPGDWLPSFYLPILAALGLAYLSRSLLRPAVRAGFTAVLCLYLAWASGTGWLPAGLSNAPAYLGLAAFSFSLMVGLALSSVAGVGRVTFGHRQVGAAVLSLIAAAGIVLQASQAALGAWAVGGPTHVPAAFALVQAYPGPPERVVWIGGPDGGPLVAPGGLPQGTAGSGAAAVRFAVGSTEGTTALDFGRPPAGLGYDALSQSLGEALSGDTQHGGALLAPFSVRFLVAAPGDLPALTLRRLNQQVDLVRVEAGGLVIFRNVESVPEAARTDPSWSAAASSGSSLAVSGLRATGSSALSGGGERYQGTLPGPSFVLLAQQFDSRWRMTVGDGPGIAPERAFGWAVGFDAAGGPVTVQYTAQWVRSLEMLILALLWGLALWITRRPAHDG